MKPKDSCPVCRPRKPENSKTEPVHWVRCDVCRQWFHSTCVSLTQSALNQLASYHCAACEPDHGPSHLKRQSKRSRVKIDYVALDQGETFAVDKAVHPHVPSFDNFEPKADLSDPHQDHVRVLGSRELNSEAAATKTPIVVPNVSAESGLSLPTARNNITVAYIAEKVGPDEHVEVMDVLSQQSESPAWNLGRWMDYFYTSESDRDRIRNVISLEVSQVDGVGKDFRRPEMVENADLVDRVWEDPDPRPQVTIYTLMSVKGSYTDFHIDFSGTPVYYTVCHGTKTFLMFPPTDDNLALYESWCHEEQQNFMWFPSYTKRLHGQRKKPANGFKVDLKKGDLFIIPSGWIHSVFTPEDAVVIGGNYLTLRDLPMHLKIYGLEKRTRVPSKYRFPMFNKVLWLTSWYYSNHRDEFLRETDTVKVEEDSKEKVEREELKKEDEPELKTEEESNGDTVKMKTLQNSQREVKEPSRGKAILQMLVSHLKEHYETSKTQPIAKKSIPTKLIGKPQDYLDQLDQWLEINLQLQLSALLSDGLTVLLDSDGLHSNESRSVLGREAGQLVHRRLGLVVQLLGVGPSTQNRHGTLVASGSDGTVDGLLRRLDHGLDELTLRGEVHTVVQQLGVADGDESVSQGSDLSVQGQTLQVDVGVSQDGQAGGLVTASGLDTDESVLDNVDSAHTVSSGQGVGLGEQLHWVGDLLAAGKHQLHGQTLLKHNGEVLWGLWSIGGVHGQLPHVLWRGGVGVFQDTGLERDVGQVLVGGPWLGLGSGDGDVLGGGVVQQVLSAGETVEELGVSPWGNDHHVGLQCVEGQLETDSVVTLTGATVGDSETTFSFSDSDSGSGNHWSGQRSTQKVDVLVDGVGSDGGETHVLDESLSDVNHDELGGTNGQGLLLGLLEVLLLTNVGQEGNHFVASFEQPGENDGGVQTAGVGQANFSFRHDEMW